MHTKFKKLLIASQNPGKTKEIAELLTPYDIEIVSLKNKNIPEPEETGITFAENAILKASYYGKLLNMPALADDSGLCIDALDGFPGVISARIAGPNSDFSIAFDIIQEKLLAKKLNTSSAHFICSLALWLPDCDEVKEFEGRIDGHIVLPPPPGSKEGFGYDPIFVPKELNQTFAQIGVLEKNKISHRKIAFDKFIQFLKI